MVLIPYLGPRAGVRLACTRFARRERREFTVRERLRLVLYSTLCAGAFYLLVWLAAAPFLFSDSGGLVLIGIVGVVPGMVFIGGRLHRLYTGRGSEIIRRELAKLNQGDSPAARTRPARESIRTMKRNRGLDHKLKMGSLVLLWPVVGVTVLLFGMVALGVIQVWFGSGDASNGPPLPGMVLVSGLALVGFLAWIGRAGAAYPSERLVLWLRRFHRRGGFPFDRFLETACRDIAVPVTLQDSTVRASAAAGEQRGAWLPVLFGMLALFVFTLGQSQVHVGVATGLMALGLVSGTMRDRWFGALNLGDRRGQRRAKKLLDAIATGANVPQALTVLSCPDERWRDWVRKLLDRADVVLIDVTELSNNLHWELEQVAQTLQPQQIVLTCEMDGREHESPWRTRREELIATLGAVTVENCQRFTYRRDRWPRWLAGLGRRSRDRARIRRYQDPLLETLSAAFEAKESRDAAASP